MQVELDEALRTYMKEAWSLSRICDAQERESFIIAHGTLERALAPRKIAVIGHVAHSKTNLAAAVTTALAPRAPEASPVVTDAPTEAMLNAGMPWLHGIQHMRAGDKRNALSAAYKAMQAALERRQETDHD